MKKLIDIKRDSLETFIREQMIGPNGCNGKFTLNVGNESLGNDEIINTTPGSIYSSAVLFPKKKDSDTTATNDNDSDVTNTDDDQLPEGYSSGEDGSMTNSERNENNGASSDIDDEEDICSISRRFPNVIGLSCCLSNSINLNKDLKIVISGRYYTKIKGDSKQLVQVIVKDDVDFFNNFWASNPQLAEYFIYNDGKLSARNFSKTSKDVNDLLRSINFASAEKIANEGGETDKAYESIKDNYRFLLSYREKLFNKLTYTNKEGQYLSETEVDVIKNKIKEIEKHEAALSCFDDLVELYDKKSFGFWRSHSFKQIVNLSDIDFSSTTGSKRIYSHKDIESLRNIVYQDIDDGQQISLSLRLQLTLNSKNDNDNNIYLKVLLENTSSEFQETSKDYFSIVNEKVNKLCFFGVKIDIFSDHILPYRESDIFKDVSNDVDKLNFLYRNINDYGVGHLCSVDWDCFENSSNVNHVFSEFLPSFETPDIEPEPRNKYADFVESGDKLIPQPFLTDTECLQFKWLSTFSDSDNRTIISKLTNFVEQYGCWISSLKEHVKGNELDFTDAVISDCRKDYERMMANISGILSDEKYMNAFRLMNSAMFIQLWHNKEENMRKTIDYGEEPDEDFYKDADDCIFAPGIHATWRPFQLAFILLNLDGIIRHPNDSKWEKRNECVDLVWFPTGGGKTEAYLGLIALSIIYRRQNYGEKGYGVTAIMRYTLRLLTTQQFQRALRLISALEVIRQWDKHNLGEDDISIGLFVGNNSLPNSKKDLDEEALKWNGRLTGKNDTKIPLDRCPLCGSKLQYVNKKFICDNDDCAFMDGLPVRLCDEDVYKYPPTLLFGTVDKFASLAHKVSTDRNSTNADSRRLFGKGVGLDCLPPDLIIQDELHLLLGPLGSAVSLFECAVDHLCTRTEKINNEEIKIRPKIISSTATTRNTELQIRALYDRDVNIFPKNGTDYDDSFFAFYKRSPKDGKEAFESKRKYMGIMPTGRTQMTTQMRLAAIILIHRALFEQEHGQDADFESVADNYYSVISYFNSLKEVGKTDAQFYTEYNKYVKRLFKRVMRIGNFMECFYANDLHEAELSGRLSGEEVNDKFAEVARKWSLVKRLPHLSDDISDKYAKASLPPDYILATNMISVGLDVSRFNTIIMNSMPRNIAEYIQASSRVARKEIGLVLALHNPFRSRDVSHFEKFREFHEKLYYYVEPISITPFSQKSIDKYLPLCMATIIRHKFESLANRNSATHISDSQLQSDVISLLESIFENRYQRTSSLDDELQKGLFTSQQIDYVKRFIREALNDWSSLIANGGDIVYNNAKSPQRALFSTPDEFDDARTSSLWIVPSSLRIVEPEAVLHVNI